MAINDRTALPEKCVIQELNRTFFGDLLAHFVPVGTRHHAQNAILKKFI